MCEYQCLSLHYLVFVERQVETRLEINHHSTNPTNVNTQLDHDY